jgi:hypothetical protein
MKMEMENGLAGSGSSINDRTIPGFSMAEIVRHARSNSEQVTQERLVTLRRIIQRLYMFPR